MLFRHFSQRFRRDHRATNDLFNVRIVRAGSGDPLREQSLVGSADTRRNDNAQDDLTVSHEDSDERRARQVREALAVLYHSCLWTGGKIPPKFEKP